MLYFALITTFSLKLPPSSLRNNASSAADASLQAWCKKTGCEQPFTPNSCLSWCDWNNDKQVAAEDAGALPVGSGSRTTTATTTTTKPDQFGFSLHEQAADGSCKEGGVTTTFLFAKNKEDESNNFVHELEVPSTIAKVLPDVTNPPVFQPTCDTCYTMSTGSPATAFAGTNFHNRRNKAFFKWNAPDSPWSADGDPPSSVTMYQWRAGQTTAAGQCNDAFVINSFSPAKTDFAATDGKEKCHVMDIQFAACASEGLQKASLKGLKWPKCTSTRPTARCTPVRYNTYVTKGKCEGSNAADKTQVGQTYTLYRLLRDEPNKKTTAFFQDNTNLKQASSMVCAEELVESGFPQWECVFWNGREVSGSGIADSNAAMVDEVYHYGKYVKEGTDVFGALGIPIKTDQAKLDSACYAADEARRSYFDSNVLSDSLVVQTNPGSEWISGMQAQACVIYGTGTDTMFGTFTSPDLTKWPKRGDDLMTSWDLTPTCTPAGRAFVESVPS